MKNTIEIINHKRFKYFSRVVVVNIIPCLSFSPILLGLITITQKLFYIVKKICAYTEINENYQSNDFKINVLSYIQLHQIENQHIH